MRAAVPFALVVTLSGISAAHAQSGADLFERLRRACAPPVTWDLLRKIAETESRFDPLAIHDNTTGRSYNPSSNPEAVELTSALVTAGHNVDAGMMQINSANFGRLDLSIDAAFDPCRSIEAGAKILSMVSSYNTGDGRAGFSNGYVRKVVAADSTLAVSRSASKPAAPSTLEEPKPHQWHEAANTPMPPQKVKLHEWHMAEATPHNWHVINEAKNEDKSSSSEVEKK